MLNFIKAAQQLQAKKNSKHSPVAIKKVVKTVEGLGFTVTGIKADPDGSFFIETTKSGKDPIPQNFWDKVLPK